MLRVIFSFIIFCLSLSVSLADESKIVYLDVNKIMQESNAGKSIKDQLKKRQNNNISKNLYADFLKRTLLLQILVTVLLK